MKRLWLIPIVLIALIVPVVVLASSGEGGFDGVVGGIESRYHAHATKIPFLGLVSLISRKASGEGVSNLHVATFENFSGPVDGNELNRIVEEKIGQGWERIIRNTSRHGGEQTVIFMRPAGQKMGLFIVDLDGQELDVVEVSVNPDHLNESLKHYSHAQDDHSEDKSE
jgi:hypothetical protein